MKNKLYTLIVIVILILSIFSVLPIQGLDVNKNSKIKEISSKTKNKGDGEKDYWALIVGVGEYAEYWGILEMCETAYELKDILLKYPSWSEDHIKVITGKNATFINIIKGLIWLDRMEDEDDTSLVYFNTHGNSIEKDIPPKDEADGRDEILVSYWGFAFPYTNILDDTLNFFLSRLESKGTAVIINCCHAGGFDDPPRNKKLGSLPIKNPRTKNNLAALEWMENFGKELSKKGRVVIMCCEEDELGAVGFFSPYLLDAFRGFGDINQDNIITAEEVYTYIKLRTEKQIQNPTIYDDYEGELPLIEISNDRIEPYKFPIEKSLSTFKQQEENSIVCGYIKDNITNDPLKNANISLYWRDDQFNYLMNYTKSNDLGFYSLNVSSGYILLVISLKGYYSEVSGWITISENDILWINKSMTKLNETSIVCGYIIDNVTNESIQNANITLYCTDGQEKYYLNYTFSNSLGFYSINVTAGHIILFIQADGYYDSYLPDSGYYNISNNETKWLNITLDPTPPETSILKGFITDNTTGELIQNANVELNWEDGQGNYQYNETRTNSEGFYSINVAKGFIRLYVRANDYFNERWPNSGYYNIHENQTKWINITLDPKPPETSIVKGYITDNTTGKPIQNVYIDLYWKDDQGNYQYNETRTNSEGFYSINVAKGFIRLYIYVDEYFNTRWPDSDYYNIDEYETKWVNLSLFSIPPENSIIKGYVTDFITGEPINNAYIDLHWKNEQGNQQHNNTSTNSEGLYTINVGKGSIRLNFDAENYYDKYLDWFDIDENETVWLNVTLNSSSCDYTVCGYVKNSVDLSPIENASIRFICENVEGDIYFNKTNSNKYGFYITNLTAGIIDYLFVDAEGFFQYYSDEDYLLEDEFILWINISMIPRPPENSEVRGYITDSETNKPIKNATIDLYWTEYYFSELHYENNTKSDLSGYYCIDVAAGEISLFTSADGYFHTYESNHYEIDENETLWVNMSLDPLPPRNAVVCGYIKDVETDKPLEDVSVHLEWQDFDYYYWDYNFTWTDSEGFYSMNISEGKIYLRAIINGYLEEYSRLTNIYANQVLWINLSMYPSPPRNSIIHGYIKDAETGEPLKNANVEIHWIGCEWHHERIYYDECTDEKGYYSVKVPAGELYLSSGKYKYNKVSLGRQDIEENEILWFNASLIKEKIDVEIDRPLTAIYANNRLTFPFSKPFILGDIEIRVYVYNCDELEKFQLYIDDELELEFINETNRHYYSYLWKIDSIRFFSHKHTIRIVAVDKEGNSDSEEIKVWRFL